MIEPYLFYNGRCEEAIEFYKKSIGAEVEMMMKFKENPEGSEGMELPAGWEEKIMHASFMVKGSRVMASDGHCADAANFDGFGLSLPAADKAEAAKLFKALGDGGQVQMPLGETFFSPQFGMVKDKFGVLWMVITNTEEG
jgi:PhnB protein